MRAACVVLIASCSTSAPAPTPAALGKQLFEDPALSEPAGQACADCHAARAAFRDVDGSDTSMGVIAGRYGARNAPSLFYAGTIPAPHDDPALGRVGGLFWDGRAANLEEQVAGPLLNPLEMNDLDRDSVVTKARAAGYAVDDFATLAAAIAAYERSPALSPFASRYDQYLAGSATLTAAELHGLAIFEDPARGACAGCHPSRPGPDGAPPLFTTFGYANVGVPRYPNSRFYVQPPPWNPAGAAYVDHGLGAITGDPRDDGLFRIPTLRDVARTAPYGHNGYFANLPYVVEFMANRDAGSVDVPTCGRAPGEVKRCPWPAPEVVATLDLRVGKHVLTGDELADLAAFLGTLDDP